MRVGFAFGIVFGGLVAIACAPPAPNKDLVVQKDGTITGANGGSGSRAMEGEETTELGSPIEDNSEDVSSPETTDGGATTTTPGTTPPEECKGWWCPSTSTKSVFCNSEAEGNKSQSTVKYSVDNGTVTILSISTLVTNKNHRNLNDAKVYAKANANEHTFVLKIDTGDTLPDNKPVSLQMPGSFTVQAGGALRIDTNFDDSFGDPTGRCELQF